MPRSDGTKLRSEVLSLPPAMVASAQRMGKVPDATRRSTMKKENWQQIAWNWLDTIGEFRYSVTWVGNLLSKAELYIEKDGKRVDDAKLQGLLDALYGGDHSEMLRQLGIHLTVAGDSYIIGVDNGENAEDDWLIGAATDVSNPVGSAWRVGDETFTSPLVIRLWRPHPKNRLVSDSPTRAVLPILSEIDSLTKHVSAQIDSRLAGAGILLLPSEITYSNAPQENADGTANAQPAMTAQGFVQTLIDTMTAAIADREDASAMVPIVLQAAGEHLANIKHLTFWSPLDEKSIELRAEAIRRLALGMDMPPEVLTGTAEMNHWSSWQVEEAAIKAHTEPLLEVISSSLTAGYLRPLLEEEMTVEEASHYRIAADTSKLRLRPNRSKEAEELYDRGELSAAALLRENGFEESDAMDEEGFKRWLLKKVASGSTTPELVQAALDKFGLGLTVVVPEAPPADTQQERPAPSLIGHPTHELPDEEDPALAAAAWAITFRALERAGNRLRSKMNAKIVGVSAAETYRHVDFDLAANLDFLLADAWTPAREFAVQAGLDPDRFTNVLDRYARDLIIHRTPLTMQGIRTFLAVVNLEPDAAEVA